MPTQVGLASNAMVLATIVQASLLKSHRRYVSSAAEAEYFAACISFIDGCVYTAAW